MPGQDPVNRNFTWGETDGDSIVSQVTAAYEQVVHMRKNLFMPPTGNVTKQFINEMTRLINEWNHDTPLGDISLKALMIMPALLLQKPSATSKSRDHTEALKRRMGKWKDGDIQYLLAETHAIQRRLPKSRKNNNEEVVPKRFRDLMAQGKVNQALRLLSASNKSGILELTEETMDLIKKKHPEGKEPATEAQVYGPEQDVNPIIFHDITGESIRKSALKQEGLVVHQEWMEMYGVGFCAITNHMERLAMTYVRP